MLQNYLGRSVLWEKQKKKKSALAEDTFSLKRTKQYCKNYILDAIYLQGQKGKKSTNLAKLCS